MAPAENVRANFSEDAHVATDESIPASFTKPPVSEINNKIDMTKWSEDNKVHVKKKQYEEHKSKALNVILGISDETMKHRLESQFNHVGLGDDCDVASLLQTMKSIAFESPELNMQMR